MTSEKKRPGRKLKGKEKRVKISTSIEAESFRRIEAGRAESRQTLSDFVSALGMLLDPK